VIHGDLDDFFLLWTLMISIWLEAWIKAVILDLTGTISWAWPTWSARGRGATDEGSSGTLLLPGNGTLISFLSSRDLLQWTVGSHHVLERAMLHFSLAKNTLVFTLIVQRVFSFSVTAFSFRFSPWYLFRSCFIFVSRCICISGLCWFSSKQLSQKGLNGVGKEKKFHAKKWYKMELV
jgi:hypothetical protein